MDNPQYEADLLYSAATAGTTAVQAGVSGKKTWVYGMRATAGGAQQLTIKRGTTTLETINLVAGVPFILPLRKRCYFKTDDNEALNVTTGQAVQTDIRFEATVA
jgi:hypothetical protein